MPKLVCLDTQVLIWGVQGIASPGQEDMIDRAKLLLQQLAKENAKIAIPSVVLGEFLIKIPEDNREAMIQLLSRGFQVVPYDTPAALRFAQIWDTHSIASVKKEVSKGATPSRHELKADILILATAIARNVECIYSADRRHMQQFAQGFIVVHDLRSMSLLGPLFDSPHTPSADTPGIETTTQE
jgi:predicted nucleic acid-binding protein